MHNFDYSFLNNGMLPAGLVNVTASISSLKIASQFRKNDFQKIFTELEKIAKIQSVKYSNEIEGIVTTDERIVQIVQQNSSPLNHNEQEILGYRDALNQIHTGYQNIQFNENTVLSLHRTMLSAADYSYAGSYKTDDNVILEIDAQGYKKVRFTPVPANETKEAMGQLFLAFMEANSNLNINSLLLIPCVILDFLCVHPFRDGNGRMSRLLSLLLLYKNGFDVGKYISFEEQINKNKAWYYQALKKSSENWHDSKNNYFPFMQNFLGVLYECYLELDKRFAVVNSNKVTKTSRIEETVLNSILPISKAEICHLLPDISPTTVEAVLGKMIKSGIITTVGSGRGTKYIRK